MSDYVEVITTTEQKEQAESIARALVEQHLAACVQVLGPITSIYRWEGTIQTSLEWLCCAKSRAELYPQIEQAIRKLHPYQVPEILAVPIIAGSAEYLAWLEGETRQG